MFGIQLLHILSEMYLIIASRSHLLAHWMNSSTPREQPSHEEFQFHRFTHSSHRFTVSSAAGWQADEYQPPPWGKLWQTECSIPLSPGGRTISYVPTLWAHVLDYSRVYFLQISEPCAPMLQSSVSKPKLPNAWHQCTDSSCYVPRMSIPARMQAVSSDLFTSLNNKQQ